MIHATIFPDPDAEDYQHQDIESQAGPFTLCKIPMGKGDGDVLGIRLEPGDRLLLMHDCRRADMTGTLRTLHRAYELSQSAQVKDLIDSALCDLEKLFAGMGVKP